jgi:hypothetical protein
LINRAETFKKIKAVWNESMGRSKIKVKGRFFNQIKELTSYYDNNITTLYYILKKETGVEIVLGHLKCK